MDEPVTDSDPGPVALPLRGPGGARWHGVSRRLITARSVALAAVAAPLLAVAVATAAQPPAGAPVALTRGAWAAAALVLVVWVWSQVVIVLQVPAISWAELPEELAIRRGRMFRSLVTVPYGRIQYVDLESGPLMRWQGLAEITVNTASPASSGSIPGLTTEVAEDLRARLAARGEAQRAGL